MKRQKLDLNTRSENSKNSILKRKNSIYRGFRGVKETDTISKNKGWEVFSTVGKHKPIHPVKILPNSNQMHRDSDEDCNDAVVNQHRALVFFQHKSMMNIVIEDLLNPLMPSVTYLRMDGSVPANSRQDLVQKFNQDPSIDLMLLSTAVGESFCSEILVQIMFEVSPSLPKI